MEKFWNYGGREYAFDITEASCLSRVVKALGDLEDSRRRWQEKWTGRTDFVSLGRMIAEHCGAVRVFFDTLFGEGEGAQITGRSDSADSCDSAYFDFISFLERQIETFSHVREEIERYYRERLEKAAGGKAESDGDPQ